uniref:Uncharacterized protein n=1 Tax=Gorilla gorilla gorilla TaxID=9595 RepID=A0A2I2ZNJ1_GORGO
WVGPGTLWWLSHPPSSVLGDVCVVLFTIGLTYSGVERARVPDLSRWIWAQALFTLASRCGLMSACGWERGMCSDVVTQAVSPADPGPALGRQEVRSPEWWARAGWPPSSIFFLASLTSGLTSQERLPAHPP